MSLAGVNGASRNFLSHAQAHKLHLWCMKADLTEASTFPTLARDAAASLGFPVTEGNMRGAFEVVERKLPAHRKRIDPQTAIGLVADQLAQLMTELGRTVPEELAQLLQDLKT